MRIQLVSIPRSEFWSFGLKGFKVERSLFDVSIPRSEFWSFGHELLPRRMVVQLEFQFLGRNSGRSDAFVSAGSVCDLRVSIPRSEFWSFGRATLSRLSGR